MGSEEPFTRGMECSFATTKELCFGSYSLPISFFLKMPMVHHVCCVSTKGCINNFSRVLACANSVIDPWGYSDASKELILHPVDAGWFSEPDWEQQVANAAGSGNPEP